MTTICLRLQVLFNSSLEQNYSSQREWNTALGRVVKYEDSSKNQNAQMKGKVFYRRQIKTAEFHFAENRIGLYQVSPAEFRSASHTSGRASNPKVRNKLTSLCWQRWKQWGTEIMKNITDVNICLSHSQQLETPRACSNPTANILLTLPF